MTKNSALVFQELDPIHASSEQQPAAAVAIALKHIPVLDGIRAIAVLLVICFHFWQTFARGPYTLIGKVAVWGQTGVDLFFVLSGFLITGILLDSKGSNHFLRTFYVRRALRIFPLYYATLFYVYVICPLLKLSDWTSWERSLWYLVYMQDIPATFAPSLASGPGHFWSLAVEEHYYFFWPFLVLALDRKNLLKVAGLAIAMSLITRIALPQNATFYFTLARLDGLAIGSALAILSRNQPGGLSRFVKWAKLLLLVLGPLLAGIQLIMSGAHSPAIQVIKSTLVALLYASSMILAIENKLGQVVRKLLAGRILGSIGKYSYGMYVIHPFLLFSLHQFGLSYSIAGLLASIFLIYIAAWISWTLIERRILRLKRYFEYSSGDTALDGTSPLVVRT